MKAYTEITEEEIEAFITTHPRLLELRAKLEQTNKKQEERNRKINNILNSK